MCLNFAVFDPAIGQGQPKLTISTIKVVLKYPMPHIKFQGYQRRVLKVFTICWHIHSAPEAPPPPMILLLAVPGRLLCFGSLVILDVACRYLSLVLLYINIKIGKN